MIVHDRCRRFIGETLVVIGSTRMRSCAVGILVLLGHAHFGFAADLPNWRRDAPDYSRSYSHPQRSQDEEPSPRRFDQSRDPQGEPPHAFEQRTPPPRSPAPSWPAASTAIMPAPAQKIALIAPTEAASTPIADLIGSLGRAIFYFFLAGLVAACLINLRPLVQAVDSLFETNSDSEGSSSGVRIEPWSEMLRSEFSAADYQAQADAVTSLKEKLDAEVEAARAAIRREQANTPTSGKENP